MLMGIPLLQQRLRGLMFVGEWWNSGRRHDPAPGIS
jgi:hypothetical protein